MKEFASVILAGERADRDALRNATGVDCKALLDIDGRPMIRRVIDALSRASTIDTIHLSGPAEACVQREPGLADLIAQNLVSWTAAGPTPSTSAHQMLGRIPPDQPVLITTGDHPLLTDEIVDHFCRESVASGCDVVIGLTPHALVRAQCPELTKTVLRFRDGDYCGCNLFAFMTEESRRVADFWKQVERHRKKPLVVIRLLGLWALLRYRMGWLGLDPALAGLSRRIGVRIGAVILPYPRAAVDVDSPTDYELVQHYVRQERAGARAGGGDTPQPPL